MKLTKKLLCVALLILSLVCVLASCGSNDKEDTHKKPTNNREQYEEACALIESGNYEEAYALLLTIKDNKDAAKLIECFRYVPVESKNTYSDGFFEGQKIVLDSNNLPSKVTYTSSDGDEYSVYYLFDSNGNLIKESNNILTRELSTEGWTITYTYDSNKNLTQEKYVSGSDWYTYDYTYNPKGILFEEIYSNSSGSGEYVYTYNNEGKIIQKLYNDYTITIQYDSNGNKIEERETYNDGGSEYLTTYEYDKNGNLIREFTTKDGNYWYSNEYVYNVKGYLVEKTYSNAHLGTNSTYKYTYDVYGNEIKSEYRNEKWGDYSITETIYDAQGNKIKETCTASTSFENYTYTYSYDSNGNLIKVAYESEDYSDVMTVEYKLIYISYGWCDTYNEIFEQLIDY